MNWAVGFGPTQFADYKKGESVLPIDVLTDADRKWMKSAEFGGTGGLEIMTGMIVEEPDIEIGAGPSSKGLYPSLSACPVSDHLSSNLSPWWQVWFQCSQ